MRTGNRIRIKLGMLTAALAVLGIVTPPAGAIASAQGTNVEFMQNGVCLHYDKWVALAEGKAADQKIHTISCAPYKWAGGNRQVDVLSEGATYNALYWKWPQNPSLYSYAEKTLGAGRAVFMYDRLGSGTSSHPVSTDITTAADAYILHQLIQTLRLLGFKDINSIGHSYGSGIALKEAALYKDVGRLVLTGYLHVPSNPAINAGNYPANQDPAFAGLNLDGGYLTSRPGVPSTGQPPARQTSFYSSSADPAVIAYDDEHKDLVSLTGLLQFIAERNAPASSNIASQVKIPVLSVAGDKDAIFCYNLDLLNCNDTAGVRTHEAAYYTGASSFTYKSVADTGHSLTLHPSANESFKAINKWLTAKQ